ncbi:MAG: magnesium and cobalt transport protein CorA [Bacteroidetes bacterium]|nr:MAG: magnesium and cobalt transport protein CorA [Bacteroidota bacterium]
MIRAFVLPDYSQIKVDSFEELPNWDNFVWIDIQNGSASDIASIEEKFKITFPSKQQQEEIEVSSRYSEEDDAIKIITRFINLLPQSEKIEDIDVSIIVKNNIILTNRNFESRVFQEIVRKIKQQPAHYNHALKILIAILEQGIDNDADIIEFLSAKINAISKSANFSGSTDEKIILKINFYQEALISVREDLFDTQRVLSLLLRNDVIKDDNLEKIRVLLKDIASLIDHTSFNFTRLEFLQNSFLGLINIEQNKIIKIFTVVSVVFMPPTLIASIYGMNFRVLPELQWQYGYPFALFLMLLSTLVILYIFRRKKWL